MTMVEVLHLKVVLFLEVPEFLNHFVEIDHLFMQIKSRNWSRVGYMESDLKLSINHSLSVIIINNLYMNSQTWDTHVQAETVNNYHHSIKF